jgi:hypothetical protein
VPKEVANMASRAHVIYDYPSHEALTPPRRDILFRGDDEPVVLPRRESWNVNFTLVASAIAAAALTLSATYAIYGSGSPTLGPTEAAELTPTWIPDAEPWRAALFERLLGHAQAVPSVGEIAAEPEHEAASPEQAAPAERELTGDESSALAPPPETPFTIERRVTPDEPSLAPPAQPEAPAPAPYPNPTTTPPEIPAPRAVPAPLPPSSPSPLQAPDNPY